MTSPPRYIAHLLPTAAVPPVGKDPGNGSTLYTTDSLKTEGFIHCSPLQLALDTANRYLSAISSVSVLIIDTHHYSVATAQVAGGPTTHVSGSGAVKIVWEPAVVPPEHEQRVVSAATGKKVRDGDFPHVYGPIDVKSVVEVLQVKRDAAGKAWEAIPGLEKYLA
ncbi:hypothetical protein BCR44DRAFT_37726 [Catenaria anguillulae PL171]|uniref:DUF952 domain-containing protein n=1 Tax=Catenaria anguillulae PL171 TaxID=765915 RepID=A0A1Y2HPD3_9FUNG|nr:hypothetical protein BCR44DRAFT_37726 [Catenaria anguillulae PL171]